LRFYSCVHPSASDFLYTTPLSPDECVLCPPHPCKMHPSSMRAHLHKPPSSHPAIQGIEQWRHGKRSPQCLSCPLAHADPVSINSSTTDAYSIASVTPPAHHQASTTCLIRAFHAIPWSVTSANQTRQPAWRCHMHSGRPCCPPPPIRSLGCNQRSEKGHGARSINAPTPHAP